MFIKGNYYKEKVIYNLFHLVVRDYRLPKVIILD